MGYWCIKHENVLVTQYNPCLLCEIDRLKAELEEVQTAYDELRLLADGRLSIKPEYVRKIERQLASMTEKHNWQCEQRIDLERQLAEARAENEKLKIECNKLDDLTYISGSAQAIAQARQEAARTVLQIISMETIDRPFEQSQAADIIRQRFGLEG